jgi:NAD(P)-dependent dehydrogenase (short-subunit alcohol dehydrogenase family)
MSGLDEKNVVVVGASRGLGRGIAEGCSEAGASVLAVGRDRAALAQLATARPRVQVAVGDATDPALAAEVIAARDPDVLAVVAGASPPAHPIHEHSWESFSVAWDVDVRLTFNWLREALTRPLRPGSRVLLMSSGAAVAGSPLSGGYAGAKATIRFMAAYADDEARRNDLGVRVIAVLPRLTPATAIGLAAVRSYARRAGVSEEQYGSTLGTPLTPAGAGDAFVELGAGELDGGVAYLLTGDGLTALTGSR